MASDKEPYRRIALPTGGDSWAQAGAFEVIPASVPRLRCSGGPLRWRAVPYDGTSPDSSPVDGDATTVDMVICKLREDSNGNFTIARTLTLVETESAEVRADKQFTERDVSPSEQVVIGLVSATQDSAAALWIFIDSGAQVL